MHLYLTVVQFVIKSFCDSETLPIGNSYFFTEYILARLEDH